MAHDGAGLRVLTMNTGKAAMCKCDAVYEHLEQSRPHFVAFQEVDVPADSAPAFTQFW